MTITPTQAAAAQTEPQLDPALVSQLQAAILAYLISRPGVTFVELCRDIPSFAGEWTYEPLPNLILWARVSLAGAKALDELQREGKAHFTNYGPSTLFCYIADGEVVRLPQAKSVREYKTPRWFPVTLNWGRAPVEMPEIAGGERHKGAASPRLARHDDTSRAAMRQRAAARVATRHSPPHTQPAARPADEDPPTGPSPAGPRREQMSNTAK
jgi:hypothetical protein